MKSVAISPPIDTDQLEAEVIQLRGVVKENKRTIDEKKQHIEQLLDYILLLRKRQFGTSSERFNKDQLNLFDEAELEQLIGEADLPSDQEEVETTAKKEAADKKQPKRRPLPDHYNRIEKIIDISDEEKASMGDDWVLIGYDTSEQLAVIPRQHYVIEFKRAKYAPKNDDVAGAVQGVVIAPRADQIIPKSIAHSSVIADVVTRKFVDGLPFYRQEKIYAREGVDLSRQTMSGWVIQLNEKLSPLMQLIKRQLYGGKVLHIDETRLQVLNEPGKENTQLSYIWVYVGGPPDKPVVWHQYADTRAGRVPVDFLYPEAESEDAVDLDASLTIMTDGYSGYNALRAMPGIKGHAACWAHVRRKFVDAAAGRSNQAAAHQIVALIGKLYLIERNIKDKTPEERKEIRQAQSQPLLGKIKTWLDSKAGKVLPKSLLGKAIHYALGLWPLLIIYADDGNIPIDNNPAENAIRPFVIGRKAWLFSGSPRGAHASATLYTLVETAKANQLEPWAYLNYLFEKLPAAKSEQALLALMPQNLTMEDLNG